MTPRPLEAQVTAKAAEDYRRRGYEVAVGPSGAEIPEFLEDFRPALIARTPGEAALVEVKVGTDSSVERLRDVAVLVNRQPGGRFHWTAHSRCSFAAGERERLAAKGRTT